MNTPREILLRQHQSASPKLDAIRTGVVAAMARSPAPETISWREIVQSLRWHLAGLSAAWALVLILNFDPASGQRAMGARDKILPPQQIWASLRENRRLLLEFSETPAAEPPAVPGRRSEIKLEQAEV